MMFFVAPEVPSASVPTFGAEAGKPVVPEELTGLNIHTVVKVDGAAQLPKGGEKYGSINED